MKKNEEKRLTVDIPESVFIHLKSVACFKSTTLKELTIDILVDYLKNYPIKTYW